MGAFYRIVFKILLWAAAIALVAATVARMFFVEVAVVGHNGMAPTLVAGDEILLWRGREANMGSIVICQHPGKPQDLVLGRVVAKPGMQIEQGRGGLRIEGTSVDRDILGQRQFKDTVLGRTTEMTYGIEKLGNTDHAYFEPTGRPIRIRATKARGGYFLLGDNRLLAAQDSRSFGPVSPTFCRGTVFMRLRPSPTDPNDLGHGWLDLLD